MSCVVLDVMDMDGCVVRYNCYPDVTMHCSYAVCRVSCGVCCLCGIQYRAPSFILHTNVPVLLPFPSLSTPFLSSSPSCPLHRVGTIFARGGG